MQRSKRHDRAKQTQYATSDGVGIVNPRARQRALCVSVAPGPVEQAGLGELKELLRTARVAVAGELVQRRARPDANVYLGKGKLEELRAALKETNGNLIACDDELTPRQGRNLEQEVGVPVVDRTAIILDIFADHAATAEGKLQVELAQLEYNLARMRGLWTHLERLGGGIGTRGPGETQIETDRRLARDRIAQLKRKLGLMRDHRERMRKERKTTALPSIALAGYTNAGKSTLLNALTGAQAKIDSRLFETLDPTTRTFAHHGRTYLLTDTVGFIRKLPHQLVEAFRATLQETIEADLILHVADASVVEEDLVEMLDAVDDVLEEIGAGGVPRILVLNKADLLTGERLAELRHRHPDGVVLCAASGAGLDELGDRIEAALAARLERVEMIVPYSEGAVMSELHVADGELLREDTPDGVHVFARLPEDLAARLRRYEVDGRPAKGRVGERPES